MNNPLNSRIIKHFYKAEGKPLSASDLQKPLGFSKDRRNSRRIKAALDQLIVQEIITPVKSKYRLNKWNDIFKGEITRVFRTHGFVKNIANEKEIFVPGKQLLGGVPGDIVLARVTEKNVNDSGKANSKKNNSSENSKYYHSETCRVLSILEETTRTLTGIIVIEAGTLHLLPSSYVSQPLPIISWGGNKIKEGDKAAFRLRERGERHSEHSADIVSVYGNADCARISVAAYLDEHNISSDFPSEVCQEAYFLGERGIRDEDLINRLDLREQLIFTIDSADTKDIDDAISLEKINSGYRLGVHIADVSHYVRKNSALDREAFYRGTSVYIANIVIPMIPKELSNGICSLNPNEDRLALSCIMDVTDSGVLDNWHFEKTVIRSSLQGVYSEINSIFDETCSDKILEKYKELVPQLRLMLELSNILKNNRIKRGSPEIITQESKITCDENGFCTDISLRSGGLSEDIIEEFMLMANNAAAKLAMEKEFPFVYRIHEAPSEEKLKNLSESITLLGFNINDLSKNESGNALEFIPNAAKNPSVLANILQKAKGTDKEVVINRLVLRSMMKAKYSPEPVGHYGLAMKEYTHFTSPIRRYPDLSIHRIMSDFLARTSMEKLYKRYGKFVSESSVRSSAAELIAVSAERDCEKYYTAEFMLRHIGKEFDGIISGVNNSGLFITLPNTVEGRIDVLSLSFGGVYEAEDNIALVEKISGKRYTLGDKIRVKCSAVSVKAGMIDFIMVNGC